MTREILWHGHANVQISSGGKSVLVDPFFDGNPVCTTSWRSSPRPDLVLITHDHGDHVGDAVNICRATGALCACMYDTASSLIERGMPGQLLAAAFNIGGTVSIEGMRICMTPAFHSSETGVPVGYVVTMPDGFTWYHAGDTALFGDMALIEQFHALDLALLPIGDMYTMDAVQAVQACTLLKPKAVLPIHWATFPQLEQSPEHFKALMREKLPHIQVLDLLPGHSTLLS